MSRKTPLQPWPGPGKKPKVWDDDTWFAHGMREKYIQRRNARKKAAKERARRQLDPWHAAERLELTVPEGKIFDCGDLPHYAVALADLDAHVRLKNKRGWFVLAGGKAISGARFMMATGGLRGGDVIPFEAIGPDAEKALEVVKAVFHESRQERSKRHPMIRDWWEHQSVPMSPADRVAWLVAPKRIMGMGGFGKMGGLQ